MNGAQTYYSAIRRALAPDPSLKVHEWSDEYMRVPRASGSNESGRYRTSRTPHAREIMECLSDSHPCKRVVLMAASQMMKTQIALNWICCSIDQSPYNFIYMMPTGNLQERISTRIQEVFDEVPNMIGKVAKKNSRDSKNTIKLKEFIGGKLYIETAGAAANLKEVSARRVAFDEIDEADDNLMSQGDPVELLEGRQTMFERTRKSYYFSSPTIEGESKIEALFKSGTQRHPLADCVHCGHAQTLEFDRLIMSEDGQAIYPCEECGGLMREADKPRMF